jgi:hypothetical protein
MYQCICISLPQNLYSLCSRISVQTRWALCIILLFSNASWVLFIILIFSNGAKFSLFQKRKEKKKNKCPFLNHLQLSKDAYSSVEGVLNTQKITCSTCNNLQKNTLSNEFFKILKWTKN